MAMYGDPPLSEFIPAYYCNNFAQSRSNCATIWKSIFTHLFSMAIATGICFGGYYYYQNYYLPILNDSFPIIEEPIANNPAIAKFQFPNPHPEDACGVEVIESLKEQIRRLNENVSAINKWRATVNSHLTKLEWEQAATINSRIEESFDVFEADGTGLMDYAASYAGGIIVGISKDTLPHPTHRPLSLFKLLNVDVLSSPEELIRSCVLPGSCFAFSGSVRIKLGKPIKIGGVTLSHASKRLLLDEGMSSAPQEFAVYGFVDSSDKIGVFLGKFTYNIHGKQHQTFKVQRNPSHNEVFEEVELAILSNYGRDAFTCVYRFRVHRSDSETALNQSRNATARKVVNKKCC
ncbi:SUN domain-containing protein 3 isoform X2 [Dendroctonus ponderosae]|uniref:SUN domain-containing protein n=1 Tax=Dendroctonus ponderosae TaxID=77166 RepID=A0AAR5PR57_DENPD|nr:SUN domain-containing protein 3 isoform X2 [Dendroctonus ponderosae]